MFVTSTEEIPGKRSLDCFGVVSGNTVRAMVNLVTTSSKRPVGKLPSIAKTGLGQGSVVISVDYFKRIVASLRIFFGGNIRAYETLVDRALRESLG